MVDRGHLKEFLNAPEHQISFNKGFVEGLNLPYLFRTNAFDDYHVTILRGDLTQYIAAGTADMVNEMKAAFADEFEPFVMRGAAEYVSSSR